MNDSYIISSLYGNPLKEFYLYPGCQYMYDGVRCIYIQPAEDTVTDRDKVLIELSGAQGQYRVNRISLSPIPLTINDLDKSRAPSVYDIGEGRKEWKFESKLPYSIMYNGEFFVYSNSVIEKDGLPPIPVTYISDVEATHSGYESKV